MKKVMQNKIVLSVVKLIIVLLSFYFIYRELHDNEQLNWGKFFELLNRKWSVSGLLFLLSFSVANRYLEILKWQNLAAVIHPITVGESAKQVLSALTAGIFTPNGLGEYAGKALYFETKKAKKVIFLNLICNGIQMILTVVFGIIGLWILGYQLWVLGIFGVCILLMGLTYLTKSIKIKGYSLEKLTAKIREIPKKIHRKNILLAVGRYLVFSHQYYFLFLAFDVALPYGTLMASIAAVYFLASSLPSFQFLDFAVKGSVALFFFEKLGVNEWIVVFIATLMWFLNVVLPVVIGSYFVLKFKPKWKSSP
jgi:type IV secretory pathway TrbD component